jgi:hypothetical protein
MKYHLKGHVWILIIIAAVVLMGGIDQTTKDALKVQHILRTIERQPQHADGDELTAQVTEKEVNAYIAHRLEREKNPVVNRLSVNLLGNNQVQGKISFNADQLNLGGLLGDELDFDFKGVVQTRNRAARLNLIALTLGGYAVKPQVLDFVLSSAGMVYNTEVGRVDDWYALPKGIKRIMVQKAKAIIYY